jgi:hypothetical protein
MDNPMGLRIDRFSWIVILLVVALLAAAVITVNRSGVAPAAPPDYRTVDEPATPVYNAFLAMQRGDVVTAREQYSSRILAGHKDGYDPFTGRGYIDEHNASRLRILKTEIDPQEPNQALVTVEIDRYYSGGLFGGGSTSSVRRTLQVVREDDRWKLDTDEYFFY